MEKAMPEVTPKRLWFIVRGGKIQPCTGETKAACIRNFMRGVANDADAAEQHWLKTAVRDGYSCQRLLVSSD